MNAMPRPNHLLTLDEFEELPEDKSYRYEVQEGVLIVSPRPVNLHATVARMLANSLDTQLPRVWGSIVDGELVVQPGVPLGVRVPDVMVTSTQLVYAAVPRVYPADVLLAVEIISPGSHRTDTVVKPLEYAEAGIPHYWVIDLEPPASLTAYHLVEEFSAYQEAPAVTGEFVTTEPFPLRVDLAALVTPPKR